MKRPTTVMAVDSRAYNRYLDENKRHCMRKEKPPRIARKPSVREKMREKMRKK
jgi:hypothetical protein